jgi:UDP-N-acetylmuramoyl-tripeptide--D-alanyl-D-alanine ligase
LFSLADVRNALGVDLLQERSGSHASFSAVTNDSRVAKPGELFVALATEVRDGHDFVADAVTHGATGVVVHRDVEAPDGVAVFRVRDTRHAIGELARYWRERFPALEATVVTGNVGKTTTKELTAAVLGRFFKVLKSPLNFNDEIGLSMTLFQLDETHERAVLEVGMFELGEIRRLCQIAQPETAVVLNVGPTHLERLGSLEAIASAKAEAVESLTRSGTAVLNADDPFVSGMASRCAGRVLTFGIEQHADVCATDIHSRGLAGVDFNLVVDGRSLAAHSPLPGVRLVSNALAAVTVAFSEDISLDDAVHALAEASIPTRLQSRLAPSGAMILDDSYNASPASMLAALGVLAETPGRRVALLGDMLELGSAEADGHRAVGEKAAEVADLLFTIGPRGAQIAAAARAAGVANVQHLDSKETAVRELKQLLGPGDVLLVKASHGLALNTVVEDLLQA